MARANRPMKADKRAKAAALPVCVAMVLCDKVIVGVDKTATLVRIVDTIGVPTDKKRKTGDIIGMGDVSLFISLKRGDSDATWGLVITCVDPSGKRTPVARTTFQPVGETEAGTNVIGPPFFRWAGEGLYWLELTAEGVLIARTPVKLKVGSLPEAKPAPNAKPE